MSPDELIDGLMDLISRCDPADVPVVAASLRLLHAGPCLLCGAEFENLTRGNCQRCRRLTAKIPSVASWPVPPCRVCYGDAAAVIDATIPGGFELAVLIDGDEVWSEIVQLTVDGEAIPIAPRRRAWMFAVTMGKQTTGPCSAHRLAMLR